MYKIALTKSAEKEYRYIYRVNRPIFERIRKALCSIAEDPYQGKPLKFELKGLWSYRVSTYRIIYTIRHSVLIVEVLDIGHRRDVYR